jgi:hypothetical protein
MLKEVILHRCYWPYSVEYLSPALLYTELSFSLVVSGNQRCCGVGCVDDYGRPAQYRVDITMGKDKDHTMSIMHWQVVLWLSVSGHAENR